MNITVIGGGPAGMMAAITAAERGHTVTLLEKNNQLGKKLAITGGGRCNLTNASDPEALIQHVVGNPAFLYSAFYTFGSEALMDFFERHGVPLKLEAKRVFPKSERAWDIVEVLENVMLNHTVTDIRQVFKEADKVIVATGGQSYPMTGSTGDGYQWARDMGHTVTDLYPALVPLLTKEDWVSSLAGLSLRDVRLTVNGVAGKFSSVGELLFTHRGVSGPLVLDASRYLAGRLKDEDDLVVNIDLMPHLDHNQLDRLLLEAFKGRSNKSLGNVLFSPVGLPKRLIPFLLESPDKKVNAFSKGQREDLISVIKGLPIKIIGLAGFREAAITVGGIDVREINPSSMASKKVPGLYFAGEILDVDALTGGFNLQIAFSTGYLAGCSV